MNSRGDRNFGHWAVENENHWVRDVTLAEDASRIRVNPGVMARLRSQALNIARANAVANIAQALWSGALDPAVTLELWPKVGDGMNW